MPPRVDAIVLNWNKPRETADCVASLLRQEYPRLSVTVVDNGSDADPAPALREFAGRFTLLRAGRNLGYTGGNNLGIARALAGGADYVWLVNNDAEAAPDCLAKLVAAAEADPVAGLASPVMRRHGEAKAVLCCGGRFFLGTCLFDWFDDLDVARAALAASPATFMLPGTALLLRRALLQRIGLLDDDFFAYLEDIDLAIRSARAGFRPLLVDDAHVYHKKVAGVLNPPHIYYYESRNDFFVWRQHAQRRAMWRKATWHLNTLLQELERLAGHPERQQAMLAGYWHGLRGITGAYHPDHRMPWPLRPLLASHPRLVRRLLRLV